MLDFHPLIADWFTSRFPGPTEPQRDAWPAIRTGEDVLISAPTGSGKTLAAFLICLDDLVRAAATDALPNETRVLYVSPLKALSSDVQKNLQDPLADIARLAESRGEPAVPVTTALRTGDTPAAERQRFARRPAHIVVTTPESFFILLTSDRGRAALASVRTVIVDEVHAVIDDKRGSHLALSLARLDALVEGSGRPAPQRIGLSATVNPIETVAAFLTDSRRSAPARIIDYGHRRRMHLAVEVPRDELGAVASNELWAEVYDRVADLIRAHRTTIVFVNTRRLAERVAHHLAERLGSESVLAHHGSLSRPVRLDAEQRLKRGALRAIVATASLELGIDVGSVDLVCQIGSPRSIGVALQRIGRSGHHAHAESVPEGRLFATTRDELVECAALVHAARQGALDRLLMPDWPVDVLAQQIVATAACDPWSESELFDLVRRAYPYRHLPRDVFDAVVTMLSEGIDTRQGRRGALLHRDRVNGIVRARRGGRLAAITSGGAIPDNANYLVVTEPEGTTVGTVDEDFAVESVAGDVFLLGSSSWRIRRVESGRVRVEDAHGAAPTVPFWRGEAPGRTDALSAQVAALRRRVAEASDPVEAEAWLSDACGLDAGGAGQAVAYIRAGQGALGAVPSDRTVVAERFFDEGGGMQLVLHAPFGARINRAWGLALRKRFCRSFNFELQAAATDDGVVISLSDQHSFPLDSVFRFLHPETVEDVLTQAMLDSPMFTARWRWNATRALAVLRFAGGRKVPPPLQRMRSEDLLAAVFPDQVACAENLQGDIRVPDHPLVNETVRDCLHEAMDLDGLKRLLTDIDRGAVRTVAVDTAEPSPWSHELLNANPYAFLDDAPLEERRTRAVHLRRTIGPQRGDLGLLDSEAVANVREESWPVVRDADELHDALLTLVAVPPVPAWQRWFDELVATRRATTLVVPRHETDAGPFEAWVPAERGTLAGRAYPAGSWAPGITPLDSDCALGREAAVAEVLRGWLESTGPTTAGAMAERLGLSRELVDAGMTQLESEGQILRGRFDGTGTSGWCNRRLLARIHRATLGRLRREIEPVTAAAFVRFLARWQHLEPGTQLHGVDGLRLVLEQLQGYEVAATAWEASVLPRRVAKYTPDLLDQLCLSGEIVWGRLSPHPAFRDDVSGLADSRAPGDASRGRSVRPTRVARITFWIRGDEIARRAAGPVTGPTTPLSHAAQDVQDALARRGASFIAELMRLTGRLMSEVEDALWELAVAGLVTSDGFENLRALIDPRRRRGQGRERMRRPRHAAGRWSLLTPEHEASPRATASDAPAASAPATETADAALCARQFLRRWGVVFRELVTREPLAPPWRQLLTEFRRLEARGEVRGGRFVSGFTGEQFAHPDAVAALRAVRHLEPPAAPLVVAAADPLNLCGIVVPGPRVSPLAQETVDLLAAADVSVAS